MAGTLWPTGARGRRHSGAVAASLIILLSPAVGRADPAADCERFSAVESWTLTMQVEAQGQGEYNHPSGNRKTYKISRSVSLSVDMEKAVPCSLPISTQLLLAASTINSLVFNIDDEYVDYVYTDPTYVYITKHQHAGNVQWEGPLIGLARVSINIADGTYSFDLTNNLPAEETLISPAGTLVNQIDVCWKKIEGGLVSNVPLPTSGTTLSGSKTIWGSSCYNVGFENEEAPIPYTITWSLEPAGPIKEKKLEDACPVSGSIVAVENQSLGEAVDIVGTPFSLVYQSDRLPGRKDASWDAREQALGGWTFEVHHAYDRAANVLHLGDGTTRQTESLGTVLRVNGEYLIASESGAEVYAFDATGRHVRTIDGLTNAVRYLFGYDAATRLVTVTDGNGKVTTIERNAAGAPTAIVSPFGKRTTLLQDADGYLSTIGNPAGEAHKAVYATGGLLTGFINPRGIRTNYAYDAEGRLIRTSDAAGGSKSLTRALGDQGRTVSVTTGMGRTTRYETAWLPGSQEKRTVSMGGLSTTSIRVPATSLTSALPDGTQISAITGLDPRWGKQASFPASTTISMPSGLASSLSRARTVQLAEASNPLSLTSQTDTLTFGGRTYTLAYAAATRTATLTTPMGRKTEMTLDGKGRVSQAKVAGVPVAFAYDDTGRLATVAQSSAPGRTITFGYTDDELTSITDPLGQKTTASLDDAGRPLSLTLPTGGSIGNGYDGNGNLTSLTPIGKPPHVFSYTPVDLMATYKPPATTPATGQVDYTYNKDRQITADKHAAGRAVSFAYDALGRLSRLSWTGGAFSYAYNDAGRLASATTSSGATVHHTYDGSLPLQTTWAGDVAGEIKRTYGPEFRLASLAVNTAPAVALSYDLDGLLTKAGALDLSRDAATGRVTGTALGTVRESFTYNGFGEPLGSTASTGANPLLTTSLLRDGLGRITRKTETLLGTTTVYDYAYDVAGRLMSFGIGGAVRAQWQYDGNGNRIAQSGAGGTASATYDTQDRLLTYTATNSSGVTRALAYAYTANGELKSRQVAGQTTSYDYDPLGNLVSVVLPDGKTIGYVIDGEGQRIGKKVNGTLVRGFLYQDSLRPAAELGASDQVVSRFVYGSRANVPDYVIKGGATYRILADHLGSPRLVVNVANSQVAQRIDYGPFGEVLLDSNPGFQPFGFAGGLYDPDTGLVQFGVRDYDAETGRWTAKDPILFAGGDTNLYGYVMNDPINFIDMTGRGWLPNSRTWVVIWSTLETIVTGKPSKIGAAIVEKRLLPLVTVTAIS